jgi:phospholipase C
MTVRKLLVGFGAVIGLASLGLSACGGAGGTTPIPTQLSDHRKTQSTPITHIVLVIQENRSFNNLFATFPGAIGTTTGEELIPPSGSPSAPPTETPIALTPHTLELKGNITHLYPGFLTAWNNGAMDGFNLIQYDDGQPEGSAPYQYVEPSQIKPYWDIAEQWGLADEMFQTQGSDSFTAHQELIRGGTCISAAAVCANPTASPQAVSLIDPPSSPYYWGCDARPGSKTTLITASLVYEKNKGPFPCSSDFYNYGSNGYETLRDLLDAKSLAWKYYVPKIKADTSSALWNAFDLIAPVRYGSEWTTNISSPPTNIYKDLANGTLPAMSWVIPDAQNSDHPGYSAKDTGPSWVASIVNKVGKSQYWDTTVVIVVWDDWGGFYDPVAPPTPRDWQGGPGFRVPMLVISPYVIAGTTSKGGYISNTVYGFGSIIRFIEDTFDLGRLGTTDETSTSIANMLNYSQTPRPFTKIPATYDQQYFMRQKPSGLPVDTE